jgi:thioredoxin-related protein
MVCLALIKASAADLDWMTDLSAAQAKAKAEKKMVLLDFTGSDWCPWCVKLHKEVFSTPEFAEYAKDHLVLVEVDFPQKTKLSPAQTRANEALARKYNIESFPTIVVLNSAGAKAGRLEYTPGGPKPFIALLEKARAKQPA